MAVESHCIGVRQCGLSPSMRMPEGHEKSKEKAVAMNWNVGSLCWRLAGQTIVQNVGCPGSRTVDCVRVLEWFSRGSHRILTVPSNSDPIP